MAKSPCQNLRQNWNLPLALPRTLPPSEGSCASSETLIKNRLLPPHGCAPVRRSAAQAGSDTIFLQCKRYPIWLLFIDEISVKINSIRQSGSSLCGKRLEMDIPFGGWGTQTLIAGLMHDNLIAPWVIKGAMDGEAFGAYNRNFLLQNCD